MDDVSFVHLRITFPRIAALGFTAAFLSISSCATQQQAPEPVAPKGALSKGSLVNTRLKQDATAGVFAKLMSEGHDMVGNHQIHPYILALPKGSPGSRRWTEIWLVSVKDKNVPVTIDFKESGMGAADFKIR